MFGLFKRKKPKENTNKSKWEDEILEHLISSLASYQKYPVTEDEKLFLSVLSRKFVEANELKFIKVHRMSTKAIDFNYNGFPIGKVKLQGRKTWMQIIEDLYEVKTLEGSTDAYLDGIDLWIEYIKEYLQ